MTLESSASAPAINAVSAVALTIPASQVQAIIKRRAT